MNRVLLAAKASLKAGFPELLEMRRGTYVSRRKVQRVLSDSRPADTSKAEQNFKALQERYQPQPEYGYDDLSILHRAAHRASHIAWLARSLGEKVRSLEVGCGDGMVSVLASMGGIQCELTDLDDWRSTRAKDLPLYVGRMEAGLPVPDATYNLVFSYNTFEHLDDPTACMKEIARVMQPNGLLAVSFNPLYGSPWGLHAYRSLLMPYPQWLFNMDFIKAKLRELGIQDLGKERTELQPLNAWSVEKFENLWKSPAFEIVSVKRQTIHDYVGLVLEYPDSFRGRGLSFDDLVTSGYEVVLKRK